MMKKLLLVFLFLMGCEESKQTDSPKPSWEAKQANSIVYTKDTRTNLCFALSTVGEYPIGTSVIVTNVPCTPEVEKLIK